MARNLRFKISTANLLLDSGFGQTTFDSGTLELRSGTQPATADTAKTGSVVASVDVPVSNGFAAASNGVLAKSGTWEEASAAGGTAAWFALENSGLTQRIDGTVGNPGSVLDSGTADSATEYTMTDAALAMTIDEHIGRELSLTGGTGSGQRRRITSNTATVIRVHPRWDTNPDATTTFEVVENFDLRMANPVITAADSVVVDSFNIDLGFLI